MNLVNGVPVVESFGVFDFLSFISFNYHCLFLFFLLVFTIEELYNLLGFGFFWGWL